MQEAKTFLDDPFRPDFVSPAEEEPTRKIAIPLKVPINWGDPSRVAGSQERIPHPLPPFSEESDGSQFGKYRENQNKKRLEKYRVQMHGIIFG